MNMKRIMVVIISVILTAALLAGCGGGGKKAIVIGAKDFTEQDILGNILVCLIKKNTDIQVSYKHEMSSNVVFEAIKVGEIDIYADYTGTVYGNYLKYSEMKSSDEVYKIAAKEIEEKFGLIMLKPLGFNNTYTLSIKPDIAEKYNLKTYSDLAKVSSELVLGATFEVLNRNDGIPNLKKVYGMSFKNETAIDGTLRYTAISNNEIQVTDAFSTDGMLLRYNLVVLEDDKNFFPPYHAVPIIRAETVKKYPELPALLDKLAGVIDDKTMRDLNYKVDVSKENPEKVAEEFLKSKGLI